MLQIKKLILNLKRIKILKVLSYTKNKTKIEMNGKNILLINLKNLVIKDYNVR